jgi:hypothetical protein
MSITRIDRPKDLGIDLQIEIPPFIPSSFTRIRKIEIFPVIPSATNLGSLLFNNSNQFLQFSRAGVISITDPASPFTIEAWIKPTAIKTIASVDGNGNPDPLEYGNIIVGDTEGGGNNWSLQLFNNKLTFYRYNNSLGGPRFYTSNSEIPLNQWTHVAVSYDGISTLSIFINGVSDVNFADYSAPNTQYSVITIGNLFDTGSLPASSGAYAYEGYITNLRINDDEYFYEMVNPFLSTAPLGDIAGTTLRLLADQNNPTKDSGPNNVTITNVGSVTSSSEYPTIYDCANNDAKVLMVGWAVGPRALTRSSNLLYAYGDETVERANTNSAWVYKNSGSTISTATSVTEYPWQAEWGSGITATKICASISSFVYNSSSALVDHIFGNIPDSWQDNNTSITQLTLGTSVTSIGNYAFQTCYGFTGSLTIPNSVTTIGSYAFYLCSGFTGSLTIGNSVESIGNYAFHSCGFTGSLTISNSVTSIGDYAFTSVGFTGSLTIGNSRLTSIGDAVFQGCTGFTGSLTIGSGVTSIGNYAFQNCGFTGSLTIPNSVTNIGVETFYGCSGFTGSLTIGNSVNSIGSDAFYGCSGFTGSLVIPNSVITINNSTFRNCSGFTSLTIHNNITSISNYAFRNCSGFTGSLTIPNSVTTIGGYAFYDCSGFTGSLTIGNSVESIGEAAFQGCNFTGSLTIPNSVTSIGLAVFNGCDGFTGSLTISSYVTSISNYAFSGCSGFTGSLTIGNSVISIGVNAFQSCSGFTGSLTIPNSVTTISSGAFRYCGSFTSLTIPSSVTTIGSNAFDGCDNITTMYVDVQPSVLTSYPPNLNQIYFKSGTPGWSDGGSWDGIPTDEY